MCCNRSCRWDRGGGNQFCFDLNLGLRFKCLSCSCVGYPGLETKVFNKKESRCFGRAKMFSLSNKNTGDVTNNPYMLVQTMEQTEDLDLPGQKEWMHTLYICRVHVGRYTHSNQGPKTKEDNRVHGTGKVHSWKMCTKPMGVVAKK